MHVRTRKLIGTILLLLLATVWSLAAMVIAQLPVIASSGWLQAAYYVVVGLAWVLVSFAALCAIAIVFVLRFLPETKGHSVEEIIELFEKEATPPPTAREAASPGSQPHT